MTGAKLRSTAVLRQLEEPAFAFGFLMNATG